MVTFPVGGGGGGMGMGCNVMEFCGSIVRALGHGVLLNSLDAVHGGCDLSAPVW